MRGQSIRTNPSVSINNSNNKYTLPISLFQQFAHNKLLILSIGLGGKGYYSKDNFLKTSFRFTAKSRGEVQRLPHIASPIIITPQSGPFVTIDEPNLTHHNHPEIDSLH